MKCIGIDIGTTSVSSVVIDSGDCRQLASKTLANDTAILSSAAWIRQQDADRILEKCRLLIKDYLKSWPDIGRIGITGQMHGMLYVNAEGKAVSPLTTWEDERGNQLQENGVSYVQELREKTGYPMATGFGLTTHFYNLKNNMVPGDAECIVTIMDYIAMRLCGMARPLMHASNAASIGLYDIEEGDFDREACRRADIDVSMLPDTMTGEQFVGRTPEGIKVMVPIGDNQAGILGLVQDDKDIVINIGTSSQISMISETLPYGNDSTNRPECRPYVNGKYLLLGAGLCGGTSFAMLNGFFRSVLEGVGQEVSKDDIFRFMTKAAWEAYGEGADLYVNTQFRGTRSDPSLRGSVRNINMNNLTPGALVLGFYKGVLGELYDTYQKMETVPEDARLLLCGNALRNNDLLRRLCGEMFGLRTVLSDQREETATGAAKLAAGFR